MSAIAVAPVVAVPQPAVRRPYPRARAVLLLVLALVAAGGYWWLNRPPGQYKPDNGGLYPINVNGKVGFMDHAGKTVITPQFDETSGFSEGMAVVRSGNKFGYINSKGLMAITPQFDDAHDFRYGRATVKVCCGRWSQSSANDRFGIIDQAGRYLGTPDLLWVAWWFSGEFVAAKTADGRVGFLDKSGKVAISSGFDQVQSYWGFVDGLAPAASSGKWGYLDTRGKWAIEPQFEQGYGFSDGLAPVQVGGKWGFIDRKGSFVINPQYEASTNFNDGHAVLGIGGKYGFIDTKGQVVVEPKFLYALGFKEGLAPVKTDSGWGYIDPTGRVVVDPQFDFAASFQDGLARVRALGKDAYITKTGAFVVDPFPGTTVQQAKAKARADSAAAAAAAAAAAEQQSASDRLRLQQGIVGNWAGTFDNDNNVRLTISHDGAAFHGVLLHSGLREEFSESASHLAGSVGLIGVSVSRVSPSASATYNLDNFQLALSADGRTIVGENHDAGGKVDHFILNKIGP